MISANELMIGNWFAYRTIPQQVTELKKDGIYSRFFDAIPYGDQWLEPIPLTPQILEKCGFEWNEELTTWMKESWYGLNLDADNIAIVTMAKDGFFLRNITYLHELQNWHYALCGEQLKVEL